MPTGLNVRRRGPLRYSRAPPSRNASAFKFHKSKYPGAPPGPFQVGNSSTASVLFLSWPRAPGGAVLTGSALVLLVALTRSRHDRAGPHTRPRRPTPGFIFVTGAVFHVAMLIEGGGSATGRPGNPRPAAPGTPIPVRGRIGKRGLPVSPPIPESGELESGIGESPFPEKNGSRPGGNRESDFLSDEHQLQCQWTRNILSREYHVSALTGSMRLRLHSIQVQGPRETVRGKMKLK